MATIEERARNYASMYMHPKLYEEAKQLYIKIATEQKEIDDADLARLKKAWEKEAEVNHDANKAYKQGYHDAIDKSYEWLRARNVLTDASLEGYKKAMEAQE